MEGGWIPNKEIEVKRRVAYARRKKETEERKKSKILYARGHFAAVCVPANTRVRLNQQEYSIRVTSEIANRNTCFYCFISTFLAACRSRSDKGVAVQEVAFIQAYPSEIHARTAVRLISSES